MVRKNCSDSSERKEKKRGCPAFCDEEGYILLSENVEEIMHPILEALRGSAGLEQMLPEGIDVEIFYRCDRSFIRDADNTALVRKVNEEAIHFVHRWRKFEANKGRTPGLRMMHHYAEGESIRPLQLKFTLFRLALS